MIEPKSASANLRQGSHRYPLAEPIPCNSIRSPNLSKIELTNGYDTRSFTLTAIDNTDLFRDVSIGILLNKLTKVLMNFLSLLRRGHFTGADSPDGLVGNDNAVVLLVDDLSCKPRALSSSLQDNCQSYLDRISPVARPLHSSFRLRVLGAFHRCMQSP